MTPDDNPYRSPETESAHTQIPTARQQRIAQFRLIAAVAVGFASGFGVWAASRYLTGHDEPWDADGSLYAGGLNLGALIAGALSRRRAWVAWLAIWLGQFFAILTVPWIAEAGWQLLGFVTTLIGSFVALPGLVLGLTFSPFDRH